MSIPKVLLVGPSLSGGGAEGRFTNIAKYLFGGKCAVAVLFIGDSHGDVLQTKVTDLGWRGRLSYPRLIWRLLQQMRSQRYDVVMAFGLFPNVIALAAFIWAGDTKLIINEITRPEMESKSRRGKVSDVLRRIFYARSTLITANSIDGLAETCRLVAIPVENGVRVVNVIDSNNIDKRVKDKLDIMMPQGNFIVCVARLEFMKRVDTVIDAFSILAGEVECQLVVIGDGEARSALESQVERLNLQDRVHFTGRLENPFPVLAQASAFVLASEFEGFSNSVLEAMFCDVPVITSYCSSDAREMCDQGAALGFEVGDHRLLAEHITNVVMDKALSDELIRCARAYRKPHALENAIPFYEDLIRKVISSTGGYPDSMPNQ